MTQQSHAGASDARSASGSVGLLQGLLVLCVLLIPVTLWAIFVHAPVEEQMGIVQKIFYFHVPSAS